MLLEITRGTHYVEEEGKNLYYYTKNIHVVKDWSEVPQLIKDIEGCTNEHFPKVTVVKIKKLPD